MKSQFLLLRRWLLRLLPEWIWPRVITMDGVEIPLRGQPWSFGTKWLLRQGGYEAEERILLKDVLVPGMQVLEMGSSIGVVTAIIAHRIGPAGKMVAIEASASLVAYASQWLSGYPQMHLLHGFGFPVAEMPPLIIKNFDEVRGSLGGVVRFERSMPAAVGDARVWDINRVCRQCNLQPELMVVDIEGSEAVMAEMPLNLPATLNYILIELHPNLMQGGEKDSQKISKAILEEGFMLRASSNAVHLFERNLAKPEQNSKY